jgi:hypothetical protein
VFDCTIREAEDALARSSCESTSRIPSSHFRPRRVAVELVEIFRERFLDTIAARSSMTPFALKWDCSAGWDKAEVKASRTGKGVRLRI